MRVPLHLLAALLLMSATPRWRPLVAGNDSDVIAATHASILGVAINVADADAEDDLDDCLPHQLSEVAPIHRDQAPVSGGWFCSALWTERLHRPPIA